MPKRDDVQREAAEIFRRLLDAVADGELEADTPQARRLLRRMEGAAALGEIREGISGYFRATSNSGA